MSDDLAAVAKHYERNSLLADTLDALTAAGVDAAAPKLDDLAPVDEFHTAGLKMTERLIGMMGDVRGAHILDAGCGIGGTARRLAQDHGARVTGIDLTKTYIEVADDLTRRTGLGDLCDYVVGTVTDMPFEDDAFDHAVTLHVAMNVADRAGFYGEIARVLRPGAVFAVFDVMKGPVAGMTYPVPWSEDGDTSHLRSIEETAALLTEAGFTVDTIESQRDFAIAFFRGVFARLTETGGPPPVGLHLLTGANTGEKFRNYADALERHMIEPVIMVAKLA